MDFGCSVSIFKQQSAKRLKVTSPRLPLVVMPAKAGIQYAAASRLNH